MKIILTESQIETLKESTYNDPDFINYIKSVEGAVKDETTGMHKAYKDKVGVVTIGYGHSEKTDPTVRLGMKIPEEKAIHLLQKDIKEHEQKVRDYVKRNLGNKPLNDEQLKMLIDYSFNVGLTKFPKFVNAVVNKDWDTAKKEYKRYAGASELKDRNQKFFNTFLRDKGRVNPEDQHGEGVIGKIIYPRNRKDTNYVNVRTSPEVNTGIIHNLQLRVTWPNAIGRVVGEKVINGMTWYQVKLPKGVGNGTTNGWVRFDNVTTNKNAKYVK